MRCPALKSEEAEYSQTGISPWVVAIKKCRKKREKTAVPEERIGTGGLTVEQHDATKEGSSLQFSRRIRCKSQSRREVPQSGLWEEWSVNGHPAGAGATEA